MIHVQQSAGSLSHEDVKDGRDGVEGVHEKVHCLKFTPGLEENNPVDHGDDNGQHIGGIVQKPGELGQHVHLDVISCKSDGFMESAK